MAQNFNLGLLGQYINVSSTANSITVSANTFNLTLNGANGAPYSTLYSNGSFSYWAPASDLGIVYAYNTRIF